MRHVGRSRSGSAVGTAARDLFERLRWRYFQLRPGARLLAAMVPFVSAAAIAVVTGVQITDAVLLAAAFLVAAEVTMRSPVAMAVITVIAGWLVVTVPLGRLYPVPAHQTLLLALLALPVAFVAFRVRGYAPWRTTLLVLTIAGITVAATAHSLPELHVAPAWVVALATVGHRWDRARRAVPAEAYDTGWVQEQPSPAQPPSGSGNSRNTAGNAPGDISGNAPGGKASGNAPASVSGNAVNPQQACTTAQTGHARRPGARLPSEPAVERAPAISVGEALDELEKMIGLEPVKRQVRSIAASIEAAHLRAEAGVATEKPLRHFVFVGPSGTGKTTVARTLAKIFYAFGLLPTANLVEAHRADLVGEHLGATAVKTNALVDSALGGVLFIDEAYSLINAEDGRPDRFGNEAVQALLKRAEDDRSRLVIILAGYEQEMAEFLDSNPGLASRFGTRVRFPSYRPAELLRIADYHTRVRDDRLDADARAGLERHFEDVWRRGIVDELGNGRFVRSLAEAAARARDVRVVSAGRPPSPQELVTLRAEDVEVAFAEVTERFRGYAETPTLEEALATLDGMVGLAPVKRQVREIAAQLKVAKMRREQGLVAQPPMRHFVFVGPPGTGKTTVARVLGQIFSALGMLTRPAVVEAHRADLVGEHLGATAIKTNKVIDSALGGVLFIDEAYSLNNAGYAGGDAFGAEAVQTLLKRAEDDRERLVVVLAGYESDMERFLRSNPGLASRFDVRVTFPSYGPDELLQIAQAIAARAGDVWEDGALDDLAGIFQRVCGRGWIAELGNGRFARSVYEKACASRDVRAAELGDAATTADLTTLTAVDVRAAYAELTTRLPTSARHP